MTREERLARSDRERWAPFPYTKNRLGRLNQRNWPTLDELRERLQGLKDHTHRAYDAEAQWLWVQGRALSHVISREERAEEVRRVQAEADAEAAWRLEQVARAERQAAAQAKLLALGRAERSKGHPRTVRASPAPSPAPLPRVDWSLLRAKPVPPTPRVDPRVPVWPARVRGRCRMPTADPHDARFPWQFQQFTAEAGEYAFVTAPDRRGLVYVFFPEFPTGPVGVAPRDCFHVFDVDQPSGYTGSVRQGNVLTVAGAVGQVDECLFP